MGMFKAEIMHGRRDSEGQYLFEAEDDLLSRSPVRVMRIFMEHLDATAGVGHIDYHLNAAMKNDDKAVVTALGSLIFNGDDEQPFICMISAA